MELRIQYSSRVSDKKDIYLILTISIRYYNALAGMHTIVFSQRIVSTLQ